MAYGQGEMTIDGTAERVLVERARTGDRAAFSQIAEAYYSCLLGVARRILYDPDTAQDVVQDALCNAFLHVAEYRHEAPFRAWLVRITRNQAVSVLRRRKVEPTVFLDDLNFTWWCPASSSSQTPESLCLSAEVEQILREGIARLAPPYRAALSLRELDELGHEEIARRLTLGLSAVKIRIHRARLTLRRLFRSRIEELTRTAPTPRWYHSPTAIERALRAP
jgi:RNA polymerase sigma-70 factor (ECF subfamily)